MNIHDFLEYGVILLSDPARDIVITWNEETKTDFVIFQGDEKGAYSEYDIITSDTALEIDTALEYAENILNDFQG